MDTSWPTLVLDIGYTFTSSVEECKNHFSKLCVRDLSAVDIAKIISLMCRTHKNLSELSVNLPNPNSFWPQQKSLDAKESSQSGGKDQTWNAEVFVQTLNEIAPNTNWKDVCLALDHSDFIIKDRAALVLLMTIARLGMQASGAGQNFPAECIYRHWTNIEGQLSLITIILKNSDVYSFSDYVFTGVPVDLFKNPPDIDNKEIASWKSLHLVEVLLFIAENRYYTPVLELFKTPIQHCPDLLFMALLQINPPLTVLRQELFSTLIPIFLGNHPNSATILHHAWNSTNFNNALKHAIMHAMSEWYCRGEFDQTRLARILDVAQDLKALSNLLNARSFIFVIDLACLASRREYLKLDKWLTDKIREHGEPFVEVLIKFLQRRCPQIMGSKFVEEPLPKVAQLPNETLNTILTCLHTCLNNVQQELADIIISMTQHGNLLLNKQRTQQVPQTNQTVRNHRVMEQSFNTSHLFSAPPNDNLTALTSNLSSLNLSNPANGSFGFNLLGNMAPKPNSPSRILNPSGSPFPIMSMPNITNVSNLGRLAPLQANDKLNLSSQSNQSALQEISQPVSKEVEDEANSYFQRIYNHPPHPTLAIDEVLDMLQRFQESQNRREREVSQCMIRNLFEEYRFFPQYPEKELQITAQLFGGMIERNLITTYMTLGLALRCVLDALRKPEGSKMYFFGVTALDRFKNKLHLYQKYCEHVRSIGHFNDFPPHIIEAVEYGVQGQEPPVKSQAPVGLPHVMPSPNMLFRSNSAASNSSTTKNTALTSGITPRNISIANATNINTLLVATVDREEKIIIPPDTVQDKTAFIFNNLSQLNLQTKCEELKDIITKDYWQWLSQYLVLKRASIELNFHALYSNFLDTLKIPEIVKMVTKETFRNIKVLLHSDKGIENFSDRSLLKNLGHWLGMMTLARNKPILYIELDLKMLLMEAYHKGQQDLLYVVPFVAKIIESCAKSKVFKPPNPWTISIMNVLAELHQEPDLKLNLKFEIEVLCKTLSLDVQSLNPSVFLRDADRVPVENQLSQLNPQPKNKQHIFHESSIQQIGQPILPGEDLQSAVVLANSVTQSPNHSSETPINNTQPEPRYNYMDIVVGSLSNLNQHIILSPSVSMLHALPQLKQFVKTAIERTISDWISPVVDRSVRIAVNTCEQIIRKDFALDPDEARMRAAAYYMVRNLTAGMAMITCRDQLLSSISGNIKTALAASITLPQPSEIAEIAAVQLASDNTELACAFIQKTAIEKAIPEIEKRLANDFELRKVARQEGRQYCDPSVLSYQTVRMPEQIRVKVGSVSNTNFSVYDEFARNIPGFLPLSDRDIELLTPKSEVPNTSTTAALFTEPVVSNNTNFFGNDEIWYLFNELATKIDSFLISLTSPALQVQITNMHGLLECIIIARRTRDNISGLNVLNKAVEGLMEGYINDPEFIEQIKIYRDVHLRVLHILQDGRAFGTIWTNRAITKCMIDCREEIRYNLDAVHALIQSNLVHITQYDTSLAQLMDSGNNFVAVTFAMQLIQHYFVDTRPSPLSDNDLFNTIDLLMRLSAHPRAPDGLSHLIEALHITSHDPGAITLDRGTTGPSQHIHSGILQVRSNEYDDPPGFIEKVEYLLKDWVTIYHTQGIGRDPVKTFGVFVSKMNLYGILKTDELITRFFRQATQICIDLVYRNMNDSTSTVQQAKAKVFQWIDAFVRLISLIVKHSGEVANTVTKINLLNKILGIIVGVMLQDQEQHGISFQQLGYNRIFIMLFLELSAPDAILEHMSVNVVTAFCHTYHILRPSMAPGFCYSWLELISHRIFIGRILATIPQQKGWSMYSQLLLDLFRYLAPFLRNAELAKPVQLLYKGTLRVLLVLLHDFPEFLCDYHFGFCDIIPPNCIQMRNLILAAFPRNMRLPDPFTPNLKVDMLNEISNAPRIFTNYVANIQPLSLRKDLDSYLKARAPVTFLSELRGHLQVSNEPGSKYNVSLLNSLVLYVGTQAISHIRSKNLVPNMTTILHCSHMDILQNLIVDLDHEGRYLFLNVIANQLRYPNSHTHYFSCALLYLFAEANSEAIQEQITRVLLERLIVNRPHPWGLLITFIELIKNPVYKFWDHDFVHCAPEIEKLFESVARSCMVMKANNLQPVNQLSENEIAD